MAEHEWSRSRYWLCHFLHSRHERPAVQWSGHTALARGLVKWLRTRVQRHRADRESDQWLIDHSLRRCGTDPAFIQTLRLLARERQYDIELTQQLLAPQGPAVTPGTTVGLMGWLGCAVGRWRRRWLGARFEMAWRLLVDLSDLMLIILARHSAPDEATRGVLHNQGHDKQAHIAFAVERLTMLYADFNFVRRNLRRHRLRLMWLMLIAVTALCRGRLIRACGSTRLGFVLNGWRRFTWLLERMVPYRRDALLTALLNQRQAPYEHPQAMMP